MQHPRQEPGARNGFGKSLGSVVPEYISAPLKSKDSSLYLSTAALEKPRAPFPLIWRPRLSGAALGLAGLGDAS